MHKRKHKNNNRGNNASSTKLSVIALHSHFVSTKPVEILIKIFHILYEFKSDEKLFNTLEMNN